MSNYPPGVSAGTRGAPWNEPDTSHDHEWEPVPGDPIYEDGAFIFREECRWEKVLNAERGYEGEMIATESIPCEETRSIRFEPSYVWYPSGQGMPVQGIWDGGPLPIEMEHTLMKLEREISDGDAEVVVMDPDEDCGEIRVEWNDWTVVYKP